MNVEAYSVPYLAGWADDLDVLRHHMSTVVTASQWILGDLDKQPRTPQTIGASPVGKTRLAAPVIRTSGQGQSESQLVQCQPLRVSHHK